MPQPTLKTLPFAQPTQCRRYEGRVTIVTGAAQGLGLVIARRLAEEGADVIMPLPGVFELRPGSWDASVSRCACSSSDDSDRRCPTSLTFFD